MFSLSRQRRKQIAYFVRSSRSWFRGERWKCPNCGQNCWRVVKRKYVVTALVRCKNCEVLFRVPTDSPGFAEEFYQDEYQSGFTTNCPSPEELTKLKATRFCGTPKDFSDKVKLLQALLGADGSRLLDYGASWGYGSWQLMQAGWDVVGYEISRPRARFAREHVGVSVFDDLNEITGLFDVFFSSHVLEHVTGVDEVLRLARRFLRPGGLFVAFTPNGCQARMNSHSARYHRGWGAVHPLYLDDRFYRKRLDGSPKLICTSPYDLERIRRWNRRSDEVHDLSGEELLIAAVLQPQGAFNCEPQNSSLDE